MSEQYSIFDVPQAAPANEPYRARRGVRLYKITLKNGKHFVIQTAQTMQEIANEIRSKKEIYFCCPNGDRIGCVCDAVRYIEHVYRYARYSMEGA